ncbi:MAG: 2-phospho-L-lactate transferase [Rhizobiales bacterium NRL2]|nr:MAG: 2-phospho-L-lactate transferase [Rhizobiales bacterium NRL2]
MSGPRMVYLSGGVGGAKLALGLSHLLPPERLTIVANTGDDFEHLGFPVCPDIDTLVYTLSGLANPALGWGRRDETSAFMETLRQLGGPDWFFLGDRDLAMHAERRRRAAEGHSLTEITAALAQALGVEHPILPMTDEPAPTIVETADGPLAFQDYFVRLRAEPAVTGFTLHGGHMVAPSQAVLDAIRDADQIVIGPSNPYISIDPILKLAGMDAALREASVPVAVISPIVGGKAIKGPTAKMMAELGRESSVAGVAAHYSALASVLVIDAADADQAAGLAELVPHVSVTNTVMRTLEDRVALARHVLGQQPW